MFEAREQLFSIMGPPSDEFASYSKSIGSDARPIRLPSAPAGTDIRQRIWHVFRENLRSAYRTNAVSVDRATILARIKEAQEKIEHADLFGALKDGEWLMANTRDSTNLRVRNLSLQLRDAVLSAHRDEFTLLYEMPTKRIRKEALPIPQI